MKTLMRLKRLGTAMLIALAAGATASGAQAAEVWLQAEPFTKTMPDAAAVAMWGFRLMGAGWADLPGEVARVPGPRLAVLPGESLTIHLRNNLVSEPVSIVIPGQAAPSAPVYFPGGDPNYPNRVRSFAAEAAPGGGTADYTWAGLKEGTYLYHSGTHPQVQVQMGLYGAVTKDYAAGQAYSGVPYTKDVLLLYSEVDPALHAAVSGGTYGPGKTVTSTMEYEPKYFLVNGASYPEATPEIPALTAGDLVLFRLLNAGLETHVPVFQGLYVSLVAEDGNKGVGPGGTNPPYPREGYSVFLPAGQTADAVLIPPILPGPCTFPIYDRALHLTNAAATNGGMYTFVNLAAAGGIPPRVEDTLMVTKDPGGTLSLRWTDLAGSYVYQVYESTSVGPGLPPFTTPTGRAGSGSTGVSISMPASQLVFYQVAAGASCGAMGPQN